MGFPSRGYFLMEQVTPDPRVIRATRSRLFKGCGGDVVFLLLLSAGAALLLWVAP